MHVSEWNDLKEVAVHKLYQYCQDCPNSCHNTNAISIVLNVSPRETSESQPYYNNNCVIDDKNEPNEGLCFYF